MQLWNQLPFLSLWGRKKAEQYGLWRVHNPALCSKPIHWFHYRWAQERPRFWQKKQISREKTTKSGQQQQSSVNTCLYVSAIVKWCWTCHQAVQWRSKVFSWLGADEAAKTKDLNANGTQLRRWSHQQGNYWPRQVDYWGIIGLSCQLTAAHLARQQSVERHRSQWRQQDNRRDGFDWRKIDCFVQKGLIIIINRSTNQPFQL